MRGPQPERRVLKPITARALGFGDPNLVEVTPEELAGAIARADEPEPWEWAFVVETMHDAFDPRLVEFLCQYFRSAEILERGAEATLASASPLATRELLSSFEELYSPDDCRERGAVLSEAFSKACDVALTCGDFDFFGQTAEISGIYREHGFSGYPDTTRSAHIIVNYATYCEHWRQSGNPHPPTISHLVQMMDNDGWAGDPPANKNKEKTIWNLLDRHGLPFTRERRGRKRKNSEETPKDTS